MSPFCPRHTDRSIDAAVATVGGALFLSYYSVAGIGLIILNTITFLVVWIALLSIQFTQSSGVPQQVQNIARFPSRADD